MVIEEFQEGDRTYQFVDRARHLSVLINDKVVLTGVSHALARSSTRADKIKSWGNTLIDSCRVRQCYGFMLDEMGL